MSYSVLMFRMGLFCFDIIVYALQTAATGGGAVIRDRFHEMGLFFLD